MKRNKLNKIISYALVAAYASQITPAYAISSNIEAKTNLEESTSVKNESITWLDKAVAEKLNKDVSDLTEGDYLSITSLDLSGKDIITNIPTSISKLKNLKSLNLSLTGLTGSIPSEIKELTKLESLILYGNELTGSIPEELYEITSLKNIELMNNNLTGTISSKIGNLVNLEKFAVGGNKITGSIPSSICNLTKLKYLDIQENSITGSLPNDLGNMTSLETILLGQTKISGSIPGSIGNLTNLKYLEIYETNLSGDIPSSIGSLNSLKTLRLRSNKLTGSIPTEIGNLSNVVNIELHENNLSGKIPDSICNLTQLEGLSLQDNNLTGELPSNIGNLKNLIRINVENNKLSGEIPASIENLTNIKFQPATFYSSFANNQFTGKLPTTMVNKLNSTVGFENNFLENIGKQKSIYFTKTSSINVKLGEKLPIDTIKESVAIKNSSGKVTGETLSPNLNYTIDVGGVGVFDSNNVAVKNINTTIRVYIENTNILTTNKLSLTTYNDSIANNWVNKEVARQVGKLYTELLPEDYLKIKEIDLSNKNITGAIPSDLYKLKNLTSLNLSNNSISGTFPTELKNLNSLRELDLSNNKITGNLPNLNTLENLNVLKVNNNLLTGSIPTFDELNKLDLSKSSFADNQLSGNIAESLINAKTEEAFKDNLISNIKNQKTIEVKDTTLKVKIGNKIDTSLISNNDVVIVKSNGTRSTESLNSQYKLIVNTQNNEMVNNNIAIKTGKVEFTVSILGTNIESLNTIKLDVYNDVVNENWLTSEVARQLNKEVKDLISSDYNKITKINLSNFNLEGSIPVELSKLNNLQELNLSNNRLTGEIPNYIFEKNLIKCDLSNNLFYGSVVNTYTKNISEYDLSNNFLSNIDNQYKISVKGLSNIKLKEKETVNKTTLLQKIKVVDIKDNEVSLPNNFKIELEANNNSIITKDLKANKVGKTTLNVSLINTNDNTIVINEEDIVDVVVEDTTKPTITANINTSKWTNKDVTITITTSDNDKISKIKLPNGDFVETDSTTYNVSTNGEYIFTAYDASGNTADVKVSVQNIDKTKPTATTSISAPDKNNKVNITIKATDTNSGLDKIMFDGKQYAATTTKLEVTKNGTYDLIVVDKAGNEGKYSIKVSSIKDTIKPTITAKTNTSKWTNKDVIITVTASDNDKISKIKLPNGKFVNSNSTTYTVSSNGNYTFTAYDASGNTSDVKVAVQNIDKTKPTATTSIAKPDKNNKVAITVKPTDKNSGLDKVTFDGKQYAAKSSHKFEVTKNGTYVLTVTDKAGNKNTYNVKVSSIKDKTKPTITAKKNTSSWTNKNVTITVTASDNDKISKIKLPNGKFVNSNKTTYTVSSNGNYTFTAYDASGNTASIKVSVQNIDKTKPTVTKSIAKPDKNKKVAITVKPTDKNSGINKITFNGKEYTAKSSHKFEVTKNGTYALTITDKAGNKNTYSIKVSTIK